MQNLRRQCSLCYGSDERTKLGRMLPLGLHSGRTCGSNATEDIACIPSPRATSSTVAEKRTSMPEPYPSGYKNRRYTYESA